MRYGYACINMELSYPQKYGGTADLVGVYQGKEAIIDLSLIHI